MTREEIQSKVIELAAEEANMPPEQIAPASHFINDLHFDSLAVVEFAMAVEDEFEISIPDEEMDRLQTVGDVIDHLAQHVGDTADAP